MINDEHNFYEYVYKLFYKFSLVKPEDVGLILSKKTVYPVLQTEPNFQMTMPLPKIIDEKYAFEGMFFENNDQGRKSLWSLFLVTLYHLSSHAACSDYAIYDEWRKNKSDDVAWQVIDFIEDIRAAKYIENTDAEISKNIHQIEISISAETETKVKDKVNGKTQTIYHGNNEKTLNSIKTELMKASEKNEIIKIADYLYKNRHLLKDVNLPNRERHKENWILKYDKVGHTIQPFGIFDEQVTELDELWQTDEQAKSRLVRRYKKHLKNLKFDTIVIPPGNLQSYAQIKAKTLPMLRRIRQQIRMIANLTDDPKIDQIGYVDMQMAIQAIASEGISNEIFERDELRRGEEAWVILVDKSASMRLRFDHVQEFAVCVSESANELTNKPDAWALFSFDNNFHILKDFKEKYNQEVQARIGAIEHGGLSLLPDALELASRVLNEDPRERKYIFVVTDGNPSGYDRIHEAFSKIVKKTEVSGITLIAIGVSKSVTRRFRNSARGTDLKTLVAKFITAYRAASSDT